MRPLTRVPAALLALLIALPAAARRPVQPASPSAKSAVVRRAHQAPSSTGSAARTRSATRSSPLAAPTPKAAVAPLPQQELKGSVSRTHKVVRGDSLSGIAVLYGTTVQALSAANGLKSGDVIRTGQELVILQPARLGGGSDWLKYARAPEQSGRLELATYTQRFRGVVLEKGRISASARRDISALLGVHGDRPAVPDRLLRLLVRVSDTFGGRPIRVVSGYRTSSYFSDSRHRHSAAVDFSILGVPNSVVRQYLLMFDDVGVGYYPNSSFVHLDVRDGATQWVDYAGPGEAPRLRPFAPKLVDRLRTARFGVPAPSPKLGNQPSIAELDEVAAGIATALDRPAPTPAETAVLPVVTANNDAESEPEGAQSQE